MHVRNSGTYSARNTSKGDIVHSAYCVFTALGDGASLDDVRSRFLDGSLIHLSSRNSRLRTWGTLQHYFIAHGIQWIWDDLIEASGKGEHSQEFLSLLYLHFALGDRLTYDFVTRVVWSRWNDHSGRVSSEDIVFILDQASETQQQIRQWTEQSRIKLSRSILAALRDFGILEGVREKRIVKPALPLSTVRHILRILTAEGVRGLDILRDDTWRLFLCREHEVADALARLAQERVIRYERTGSTVVLQIPPEWESDT